MDIYIASCAEDGGILHCKLSSEGKVTRLGLTQADRPMYMIKDGSKMHVLLRAPFQNDESGLQSFDIAQDGTLHNGTDIISTKGQVACHLCEADGKIYAANYISGSVIRFPDKLDTHTGCGTNPERQSSPHTHFVAETPDKKYICSTDLGLDSIFFYDHNLNRRFVLHVPDGFGARHLAFSEDGRYLYCVNELKSSVSVFRYDGDNSSYISTYPALPEDFTGSNLAAAIRIRKDRLYISNRGHDSIAVFSADGEKLTLKGFYPVGREPRDFNIFDDLLVCCNMLDNDVTIYKITEDGLVLTDRISDITEPLCII